MFKRLINTVKQDFITFLAFFRLSNRAVCVASCRRYLEDGLDAPDYHLPLDKNHHVAESIVVDPKRGDSWLYCCKRCGKPFLYPVEGNGI